MEKAMALHSSTLAWKIPWMEEPGKLQSMGSLRVGHDWATSLSLFLSCIGEGNGNPLQCSCLENHRDGGAWWAAIYGVAQSQTRLKRLSSSSSSEPLLKDQWVQRNLENQDFMCISTHFHSNMSRFPFFPKQDSEHCIILPILAMTKITPILAMILTFFGAWILWELRPGPQHFLLS